ncbi:CARDB domain-containing protein [Nocardioides conyzicola]|uniref:CARDB domain-containing protein n=1 Tax=Nocardioides conyzicola TaxID=1651781 RepID=UPI0031E50143
MALSLGLVLGLLPGLVGPPPTYAAGETGPDLVVTRGSVRVTGERVVAALVVTNGRGARARAAGRSVVRLTAERAGRAVVLGSRPVPRLAAGHHARVRFAVPTARLQPGRYTVRACADPRHRLRERSERNNCRVLGRVTVRTTSTGALCTTRLCDPLDVARGTEVPYTDASGSYWVYVPDDGSDAPYRVLIWLHGCGGDHGDIWGAADYWGYHYIAIVPDGAEGGCWSMSTGPDRVLRTVASLTAHFDIDPRRVVLGGYSSGGDLAYRTAFLHAERFAGVLAMNTSPFRDNGTTPSDAAQAAWRFPVVHLLHTDDETYPEAGVDAELADLEDLGYPVTRLELAGTHWDEPTDPDNPTDGTWHDFQEVLVKGHMDDDWVSP